MTWIFKAVGMLLLFCAMSLAGLSRALRLKARLRAFEKIISGLDMLDCRLKYESTERQRLLSEAFDSDILIFSRDAPQLNSAVLSPEEAMPFFELLSDFGSGSAEAEHRRIALCRELIYTKMKSAERDCGKLSKVYCSLGLSAGAALCLLLM